MKSLNWLRLLCAKKEIRNAAYKSLERLELKNPVDVFSPLNEPLPTIFETVSGDNVTNTYMVLSGLMEEAIKQKRQVRQAAERLSAFIMESLFSSRGEIDRKA